MADKIKELLSVLDLPEEQHIIKLLELGAITSDEYDAVESGRIKADMLLADLAFSLRDEGVKKNAFLCCESFKTVYMQVEPTAKYATYPREAAREWFSVYAKPIHWIIAALIAKQLTKGE